MRLRSLVFAALILGLIALAAIYVATSPSMLLPADLKPRAANVSNGETMFNIGGCASCHTTVNQSNRLSLGGGLGLHTASRTFKVTFLSLQRTGRIEREGALPSRCCVGRTSRLTC